MIWLNWDGDLVGLGDYVWLGDLAVLGHAGDFVGLPIWLCWTGLGWRYKICLGWRYGCVGLSIWLGERYTRVRYLVGFYVWLGWRFCCVGLGWRFCWVVLGIEFGWILYLV